MKKPISILTIILFLVSFVHSQALPNNPTKEDLQKTNAEMVKLFQQKKYDEALLLAQKAVLLAEQVFGKNDLETAKALRNLGFAQYAKNETKAAEDTFEKALDIYKKIPDLDKQNGVSLTEMLEVLASIKYQKQIDSAEKLYELALSRREKTDGADSIKTAKSLSALANISYWKKDYEKAAKLFQRLLEITAKNPGDSNFETSLVYYRTECAYRKAEKEKEFEPLKQKYSSQVKPPAKDTPQSDVLLQSGIINGKAINLAQPAYPAEARRDRAEGEIKVQVIINEEGNVIYACAVKDGHPALMESAEISAYRSKFEPTTLYGKPVKVFGFIVYRFVR